MVPITIKTSEQDMKKLITAFIFNTLIFSSTASFAQSDAEKLEDEVFSTKEIELSDQERKALEIAKRWRAGNGQAIEPFSGANGAVEFVFGTQQVSIVCAVLNICDIQLQPGEVITPQGLQIGDRVRWTLDPAVSGYGQNQITHVLVKPRDAGLETSLVITTNRRTYHLRLVSHRTEYMPLVTFAYPDETLAKWEAIQKRQAYIVRQEKEQKAVEVQERTIPETGAYLGNLSFDYDIKGKAPWKPLRVYNDGVKTIIQMPPEMKQSEAPVLLLSGKGKTKTAVVNYRLQDDRFIVDSVFKEAILISGVGSHQEKITIKRN